MRELERIDRARRLYVLREGHGYSCRGFDIAHAEAARVAAWLGIPGPSARPGTRKAFGEWGGILDAARARHDMTGERCPTEMCPALTGLEGWRVVARRPDGSTDRFIVGRSTGWAPIHLRIAKRNSSGGLGIGHDDFVSAMRIERIR